MAACAKASRDWGQTKQTPAREEPKKRLPSLVHTVGLSSERYRHSLVEPESCLEACTSITVLRNLLPIPSCNVTHDVALRHRWLVLFVWLRFNHFRAEPHLQRVEYFDRAFQSDPKVFVSLIP